MRVFYRLPADVERAAVDRYKVNGWYNLAVTSLHSGACSEAVEHGDEALAISPDDPGAREIKALAQRCLDGEAGPRDRDRIAALTVRALGD